MESDTSESGELRCVPLRISVSGIVVDEVTRINAKIYRGIVSTLRRAEEYRE